MSRRTETAYKARSQGKSAQDYKTPDSGDRVNAAANVVKVHVLIRGELLGMRPEMQRFQVFVNPCSTVLVNPCRSSCVEIPELTGSMRPLGISTVLERLIQQAMAQVPSSDGEAVGVNN